MQNSYRDTSTYIRFLKDCTVFFEKRQYNLSKSEISDIRKFVIENVTAKRRFKTVPIWILFIGMPNVGKSSLINSLKRQPIVLLDEICSHLDIYNRDILLELINSLDVQTFITGTEKNFFSFLSTKASYYYIN